MDNLTHTLYGITMSKAGLDRISPRATVALVLGANLPDIDLITLWGGSVTYLKYHRGITHSVLGVLIEAALLAGIILLGEQWLTKARRTQYSRLYLLSLAGLLSHLLLDYTNSYGIRPFLPMSAGWFAGDLVFIIDPWMLLLLSIGLIAPFLSNLTYREIGAIPAGYRMSALCSLGLVLIFWCAKSISHHSVIRELKSRPDSTALLQVHAFPQFLNPLAWYGIVETPQAYHLSTNGWSPLQNEFERRRVRTFQKSEDRTVLDAALKGDSSQIFMNFARCPLVQVSSTPGGYQLQARDLRFDFASRMHKGFMLTVELDRNLRIISEQFQY
jgi:inner membrane protein